MYKQMQIIIMKILLIITACFFISSCHNTKTPDAASTIINIDIDARKPITASEYFSHTDIVELETGDESVIADISKIMFADEFIAIADRRGKQICLFGYDGHHIRTIRREGRGPQEYISMSTATIDPANHRFIIYDDMTEKLKFYTYEGEWDGEQSCEQLVCDMTVSNNTLYMTLHDTYSNTKDYVAMMPLTDGGNISVIYPFTAPQKTNIGLNGTTISNCSTNVLLSQRFDNNIYEIVGDKVTPKYTMNFGTFDCTDVVNNMDGEQLTETLFENNHVYGINNMMETDKYLFFRTNIPGIVIYDKQKQHATYCASIKVENVPISTSTTAVVDNTTDKIVSILSAGHVLLAAERFAQNGDAKDGTEINEQFQRVMDNITEDSNPVIMIHHLK